MTCKRIVSLILAAMVLAGLGGCGKLPQNSGIGSGGPVESVSNTDMSEDNWFEDNRILNTAFTREALAEKPLTSTKSGMDASDQWASLFIKENYKNSTPYDLNPGYIRGEIYNLTTAAGDKERFATTYYYMCFKAEAKPTNLNLTQNGEYAFYLQVIMKAEGDQYTLIGFVTSQDRDIDKPAELINFLSGVPGYEKIGLYSPESPTPINFDSLGTDFTEKKVDESGLSAINLSALVGGLEIVDMQFFTGDLLAVLVCDPTQSENNNPKTLMVFAAEELKLLYQKTLSDPIPDYIYLEKREQTPVLLIEVDDVTKYYTITKTGISEYPEDQFTRYRLSDTAYIIEDNNNLVLEQNGKKKILLKGINPTDDEDQTTWQKYFFYCRISDTRFIYEENGYEWFNECGIYDIVTGITTPFTHKDAPCLYIKAYKDGKAILIPDDWSFFLSIGPYLYDESTGELIDLYWLEGTYSDGYYSSFVLAGNLIAVVIEDYPLDSFRVFDLTTKTEILNIPFIQTEQCSIYSYLFYASEHYYWISTHSPHNYLFRIPIEEVMKK